MKVVLAALVALDLNQLKTSPVQLSQEHLERKVRHQDLVKHSDLHHVDKHQESINKGRAEPSLC